MDTVSSVNVTQPSTQISYSPLPRTWAIKRWKWGLNIGSLVLSPFSTVLQYRLERDEAGTVVFMLVAVANLSIQAFLVWSSVRIYLDLPDRTQARRDSLAEIIDWQLQYAEAHIPFVLYLRPFLTTGHLTRRNRRGRVRVEFESSLVDAISHWSPVIGLGNPSAAHVGVGRVFARDAHWQQVVYRLAESSDAIVLLIALGDSEATAWELKLIRESGWLWKTVAIMPPASDDVDVAFLWHTTAADLGHTGIRLPEYRAEGAFFRITEDGSPMDVQPIPYRWFRRPLREALEPFRASANAAAILTRPLGIDAESGQEARNG